jgi:hypothetical protein
MNGCSGEHKVLVYGTKGYTNCFDTIYDLKGDIIWKYPAPKAEDADQTWNVHDPFVVEHAQLVEAIRSGKPVNNSEALVNSTLMAIMGRMSAYTGKDVTWDEVKNSVMKLGPDSYAMGEVQGIPEVPPIAGGN